MPKFPKELSGYFSGNVAIGKSILPNFRFYVTIFDNPYSVLKYKELYSRIGIMPTIKHWHVLNISIPQLDVKKETQMYGPLPKSFPYIDFDGHELKMQLEEDSLGTIGYFINWLQKRIVDKNGLYTPPDQVKLDRVIVEVEDMNQIPVVVYTFHKCYFLNASDVTLDYSTSDSIKYDLVMNADWMDAQFIKMAPLAATGAIRSLLPGI